MTSTKIRPEKQEMVEQLKGKFKESQIVVLTNYRGEQGKPGLTVKEVSILREKIRDAGSEYKVIKNTLACKAIQETDNDKLIGYFAEPTAAIFGYKDPVATAKAIVDFKKEANKDRNHLPVIKAAYMKGKFLSPEELETLATLPSREVLLGQLAGVMNGPVQNLVGVLAAPMRDFVNVLNAIKRQKEEQG
ncbi:MAG: 50S ribosomal protein L10 [Candidatus Eremiobacterota bacterium]